MTRATLIGFGEAGQAFACGDDWPAFDINPAKTRNVTLAEAVDGTKIILSVVTADQALAAARQAAELIEAGALFCDMNSVAPGTKQEAALLIEAAGGRYVDVAVMSPVYPTQRETPLLLAGPHGDAALAALVEIGFTNARVIGDQVGRASTIKMLRSVMYKGLEALTAECLIAAERAGVIDDVLDALEPDWSSRANYRLNRMMVHGLRRAAEMEESAKTLAALGVEPLMTLGTVERQRAIGMKAINPPSTLSEMLKALEK